MGEHKYPKPKVCAFCGASGAMSREHAWGDWIKGFLPPDTVLNHDVYSTNDDWSVPGKPVLSGQRTKKISGAPRSLRLPVVCASCNNGWMSRIEQQMAIPILGPLLRGDHRTLTIDDQTGLALWVEMKMMVKQLWGRGPAVNTPEQRRLLMDTQLPDPLTKIWIGSYEPADDPIRHRHYFWGAHENEPSLRIDGVVLGPVMFYFVGGRKHIPSMDELNLEGIDAFKSYVQRIWPPQDKSVDWPLQPMNYRQFYLLCEKWNREQEFALNRGTPGPVPELFEYSAWPGFSTTHLILHPVYGLV